MLKSRDSEKSVRPLWRVGQKLSVSAFNGGSHGKANENYYSITEEDEERFVTELQVMPGKSAIHY